MAEVKETLKIDKNLLKKDKVVDALVQELSSKRAKILDDFFRVYVAGRKLTTEQIKRLELVEEESVSRLETTFRFRLRKKN